MTLQFVCYHWHLLLVIESVVSNNLNIIEQCADAVGAPEKAASIMKLQTLQHSEMRMRGLT